jgi:hypothetical protein
MNKERCESIEERTGDPCPCYAQWIIQVGTRVYDKQRACGRHLHPACRALAAAEARTGVHLTITSI